MRASRLGENASVSVGMIDAADSSSIEAGILTSPFSGTTATTHLDIRQCAHRNYDLSTYLPTAESIALSVFEEIHELCR